MAKTKQELLELDALVTGNLKNLAQALSTAVEMRFMSVEHGKNIWKAYLQVSGMDLPKQSVGKEK